MNLRELDLASEKARLRECVIELQEFEREFVPSMPSGESICTAYIDDIVDRCRRHDGRVFVSESEDGVVGYVLVYARMTSDEIDDGDEPYGYIGDLAVRAGSRGQGIGRALLERAERSARASGVRELRIGVLAANTVAVELYRRSGFRPFSIELAKSLVDR